jgi:hypothetical protein
VLLEIKENRVAQVQLEAVPLAQQVLLVLLVLVEQLDFKEVQVQLV